LTETPAGAGWTEESEMGRKFVLSLVGGALLAGGGLAASAQE
jgi:hypothetical protein